MIGVTEVGCAVEVKIPAFAGMTGGLAGMTGGLAGMTGGLAGMTGGLAGMTGGVWRGLIR